MAHKVKCPICGETFDRDIEEFVQEKRRYLHKKCFEDREKALSKEEKDLKELEEYILKLFGLSSIPPKIRQQIKIMKEAQNLSYSGILKSLIYFYDVKKNSLEKSNGGIGIVPFVYRDAYKYYFDLHQAQQKNEGKDINSLVGKRKTIIIESPKRQPKIKKMFNLEEEES